MQLLTTLAIAAVMFASSAFAADPDDLQKLKDNGNCINCDLRNADLRCTDLSDANLSGAGLEDANLESANLYAAILNRANIRNANIMAYFSAIPSCLTVQYVLLML